MRDKYVKWLRKETVNASELYFTIPEQPDLKLSIHDVLEYKEKEWIEKSVALSKECSLDVIQHSIEKLTTLNETSPEVPHKILAVGCSIRHAENLLLWYREKGLSSVIVHSQMSNEEKEKAFSQVENHHCQVVISVNMLMEGYDHRYLTILAIFRPYRSLNAFSQVVGRVLRSIPNDEITAFEIDNNAIVIYHEETGLDVMWDSFQREVERAKRPRLTEITITDREYGERDSSLANVSSDDSFVSDQTSYLEDIDFNMLFEQKRAEIISETEKKLKTFSEQGDLSEDALAQIKDIIVKDETNKASKGIDADLIEKRPDLARREMRKLIKSTAENDVATLLNELNMDDKGIELANIFEHHIPYLKPGTPNDGTLMRYINVKLAKKYGPVDSRDNSTLKESIDAISGMVEDLRRLLK
jgi:type I site-specific restriction endonuclease